MIESFDFMFSMLTNIYALVFSNWIMSFAFVVSVLTFTIYVYKSIDGDK